MSEGVSERHIEIMRGDLTKIIYDAGRNDIEYLFGNSISTLRETRPGSRGHLPARPAPDI